MFRGEYRKNYWEGDILKIVDKFRNQCDMWRSVFVYMLSLLYETGMSLKMLKEQILMIMIQCGGFSYNKH